MELSRHLCLIWFKLGRHILTLTLDHFWGKKLTRLSEVLVFMLCRIAAYSRMLKKFRRTGFHTFYAISTKIWAEVNKCKEEKKKEIQTEGFCSVFLSYSLVLQEKQTTPRSQLKVNMLLAICFTLVSYLANFPTLKMGLIYSSETPVSFY
jgi:hypothetical protein